MAYEVWVFSNRPEFKSRGGVVSIEVPPPDHSLADVQAVARKLQEAYATEGLEVSTVVRQEASY